MGRRAPSGSSRCLARMKSAEGMTDVVYNPSAYPTTTTLRAGQIWRNIERAYSTLETWRQLWKAASHHCVPACRTSIRLSTSSTTALATCRGWLKCCKQHGCGQPPGSDKAITKCTDCDKHFELISETDLQTAQGALLSEIRPEVDNLLKRVENYLDKLERREQSLLAKCDLNDGRLGRDSTGGSTSRPASRAAGSNARAVNAQQELRYKQLKARKDRLGYAVETLELQAKQRERQLRMSMAAPQQFDDY